MVLIIDSGKNVTDIKRRKNIVLNSKNDAAFYFNFFYQGNLINLNLMQG